jgi:hypothetical protein
MQVGDVVLAGHNVFRITGIYLGGVATQNLDSRREGVGQWLSFARGH